MSGTLKVTTLQDGGSSIANITLDASGNATVGNNLTVTGTTAMASSFKRNRIINGNMAIDQRNSGAAFGTSINGYTLDRWRLVQTTTNKLNGGQNYNSVTPPVGFAFYLGVVSQSAYAVSSSDAFYLQQPIEGFNIADLNWGTANAKTITLSFQVYSSLTGTFGGCLRNGNTDRSYPFTYTISSASTWTSISITIAGDTSGTWGTLSGAGIYVSLGLGVGTTNSGTAGAWTAGNYISATGAVSVVGTSSATFYITGVQLEVGTKATPYEMQIYSDQLAQCQRYYEQPTTLNTFATCQVYPAMSTAYLSGIRWLVPKRAAPTVVAYSRNGTASKVSSVTTGLDVGTSVTPSATNILGFNFLIDSGAGLTAGAGYEYNYTASAEL